MTERGNDFEEATLTFKMTTFEEVVCRSDAWPLGEYLSRHEVP